MIFELLNNCVENLLISFFITQYLEMKDNRLSFILYTVIINTILSSFLSSINIIGITQTLFIQIVIILFLHKFHSAFSFQDIITSLFVNILLFICIYISIYLIFLALRLMMYIKQKLFIYFMFFYVNYYFPSLYYYL